jgi:uncharacterized membrane protein
MAVLKLLHLLSVVVWVGGMFFAYMVLRPAAVEVLEPPMRLRLWHSVFRRFFPWVWGCIATIVLSGIYLIYLYGGMAYVGRHIHIMVLMGTLMILIYLYVYFACYLRFGKHVSSQRWKEAGELLGKIRTLIGLNLTLGLSLVCEVLIGAAYF